MKTCTKCGLEQPLENYNVMRSSKDGLTYHCKTCIGVYHRARYNNPKYKDYQRDSSLRATYGISLEEYRAMLNAQGGMCAICEQPERRKHPKTSDPMMLAVDHDHETGQIRELLCATCNFLIGHAQDDIAILERAVAYLSKWEVKG